MSKALSPLGVIILGLIVLSRALLGVAAAQTSTIKDDYDLIFFPAVAHFNEAGKTWAAEIHGCVYEHDKRRLALAFLRDALALDRVHLTSRQQQTFNERARLFMVDHKGGRKVVVNIGDHTFTSTKTKANGNFSIAIELSNADVKKLNAAQLDFQPVLSPKDQRVFKGSLTFAPPSGITVISDIDDTIKITQVHDRKATLRNTFLEPFKPVPGMAEVYRNWATNNGAEFFYVSASPWQLFLPLSDFVTSNGFPFGTFYLKDFRLKDQSLFNLFESPAKFKPVVIEPLMKLFAARRFVLVGDSGERDPEIYGALARRFPGRVKAIFIRNVTGEPAQAPRYQQAFRDLPESLWTVFADPSEIATHKLDTP